MRFEAGLDGVTFLSREYKLLGGFYKAAGETRRPTAILLHGLPGIEKNLDVAYGLRDLGWNSLYFHYRGCWGSEGTFSMNGLADDARAALNWVLQQPSVDPDRIAFLGASTGSHPAFLAGAADQHISAIVGISPLIEPRAFKFPKVMATEFATMLNGVTSSELLIQWDTLAPLSDTIAGFAPRPVLLVTAGRDSIFPYSDYADLITPFTNVQCVENEDSDHSFSCCRPWLVRTITDWLVANVGT
jgi:uncharacterized protein